MIAELFRLEWKLMLRSRQMVSLLACAVVALALAAWWSASTDHRQRLAQTEAVDQARESWLARGAANPHGMAHFGDFVFRPSGPLARFDGGVQALLGHVLRVEGHKQGSPLHRPASIAGSIGRFGRFDPAFVLQVLIPVLMFLIGATASASDRQSGRFRLALVQGVTAKTIALSRILALWSVGALALVIVFVGSLLGDPRGVFQVDPTRLLALFLFHLVFLGAISGLAVFASFAVREARQALLILLIVWVAGTAILPRVTATAVSELVPLPTRDAFETAMKSARAGEMDGHNPTDVRVEQLKAKTLEQYGVENVEALPINFDGIAMQVDEEVGNEIWDDHFGRLKSLLERQRSMARFAAAVNPFQAIDSVSMTIAGTDLAHDLHFQDEVEQYRRVLIKALNDEHAYGGSKTGDWGWKAEAGFFAGLDAFDYQAPSFGSAARVRAFEIGSLMIWCFLAVALALWAAGRLESGARA